MAASKKIVYFDFLNITACLCVLGMHCNGIVHNFDGSVAWKQSMAVETLGYWAVPVFFMLSGATLMNYRKRYSTKEFFKKRFIKTCRRQKNNPIYGCCGNSNLYRISFYLYSIKTEF